MHPSLFVGLPKQLLAVAETNICEGKRGGDETAKSWWWWRWRDKDAATDREAVVVGERKSCHPCLLYFSRVTVSS